MPAIFALRKEKIALNQSREDLQLKIEDSQPNSMQFVLSSNGVKPSYLKVMSPPKRTAMRIEKKLKCHPQKSRVSPDCRRVKG